MYVVGFTHKIPQRKRDKVTIKVWHIKEDVSLLPHDFTIFWFLWVGLSFFHFYFPSPYFAYEHLDNCTLTTTKISVFRKPTILVLKALHTMRKNLPKTLDQLIFCKYTLVFCKCSQIY